MRLRIASLFVMKYRQLVYVAGKLPSQGMHKMKVLNVKGTNLIDVFIGQEWGNWSRYRRVVSKVTKKAIYVYVKGNKLNMLQLKELYGKVK